MDLTFMGIFGAGLLTFLSPCVLPMVPIIAANYLLAGNESRFARLRATLLFSFGFLLTFTLMGLSLPLVSDFLGGAKGILLMVSGIFIIVYGLKMSGIAFKDLGSSKWFSWMERSAYLPDLRKRIPKSLHGFLFGATFGLAWTPCVGPVLGGVLAYVATQDRSLWESALMMVSFAMGIVIPFLALAVGGDLVQSKLNRLKKYLPKIEEATGYGLIFVGFLILTQSNFPQVFTTENSPGQLTVKTDKGENVILGDFAPTANKLLFFHTSTCPVCHAMEAYLPEIERDCQNQGFQIVRINVELPENQEIAQKFKVRVVPTISLISADGKEIAHSVGYQSESKLRQGINLFPKIKCASAGTDSEKSLKPSPSIPDGKSCESDGNGLTC